MGARERATLPRHTSLAADRKLKHHILSYSKRLPSLLLCGVTPSACSGEERNLNQTALAPDLTQSDGMHNTRVPKNTRTGEPT